MAPAKGEMLSGRCGQPVRNASSARLPVAPARRARRRGRALIGGPTCAAAVDVGTFVAAPVGHDGGLEEAATGSPRRIQASAEPFARLGALVLAAASALVPLLHGLASAIVTAALRNQATAPVLPNAHTMCAGSGAGRQPQAGTGDMAGRGGASRAHLDVGQQHAQLDWLSILLAPIAPLAAPRKALASTAGSLNGSSAEGASHAASSAAAVEASQSVGSRSEDGVGPLEEVLLRLQAASAASQVRSSPQFDAIRALLAAAPAAGEPRRNFALSLVDGMAAAEDGDAGVFGQAAMLLELSLDQGQPQLQQGQAQQAQQAQLAATPGVDQLEHMLTMLMAAVAEPGVQADPHCEALASLLAAAPPAGEARRNFARSLLDGIAAADDDDTGVFGAARTLLEQALEREEAGTPGSAAVDNPAAGQYEQLLQALSTAASSTQDPRFAPVQALLAAAPEDAPARRNFARNLVDGIAAANDQGDSSSVFGLAGLLLDSALEDGSLAPAAPALPAPAATPASARGANPFAASSPTTTAGGQLAKQAQQPAAVSKYDGLRLMLRQATVEQSWGVPKFDPLPALTSWAATPTLTRWQQYALAGEYDRFDPVAQLLQAAKQASRQPASESKYCPVSGLLRLLRGERESGAEATEPVAALPLLDAVASSSEDEQSDQPSRLLAALSRAAAQPGMQLTRQYDDVRALLAAAPPPGEARGNFVRSLLDGIAVAAEAHDSSSLFGQARVLLEMALEEEPGLLKAASNKFDRLLDALEAEAQADPRFEAVHALLAAAPLERDARRNFALSLVDGITAAQEQGDSSSVFGLAGLLLDSALDADPSLLEEDEAAAAPAAAPPVHASIAAPASHMEEAAEAPQLAAASAAAAPPAAKLEPTGIRSKYDPITALLSWAAAPRPGSVPTARQKQPRYDPVAAVHAAAIAAAPAHEPGHGHHHLRPKYCLVQDLLGAALDGLAASSKQEEACAPTAAGSG